jgi:hypothetical protein
LRGTPSEESSNSAADLPASKSRQNIYRRY